MSYYVHKVSYSFNSAGNPYAIFIETDDDRDGCLIHLIGDLQEGMDVQIAEHMNPRRSCRPSRQRIPRHDRISKAYGRHERRQAHAGVMETIGPPEAQDISD
jgi:hypothetical protein